MLHIEMVRNGASTNLWKIERLSDAELSELNSMEYREMENKVLDIVNTREHDYRTKGLGTVWHNGYGVYNTYILKDTVYVEVGKSCD